MDSSEMRRAIVAVLLTLAGLAGADAPQIWELRQLHDSLVLEQSELVARRDTVATRAGALSARIDSLKEADTDADALQEALRASLGLVQRMVGVDRQLERVRSQQDSVRERLRVAYDWEIGRLIQQLDEQPDRGLLAQLMVYQEERERLGAEPLPSELQYGAEMAIRPTDGPDEIRQKMELMEDIAVRLQTEARRTRTQLARLEQEHRLRTRVRTFSREISLFDEHLPEGRVLVRAGGQVLDDHSGQREGTGGSFDGADAPASPGSESEGGGLTASPRPLVRGARQVAQDGELRALGGAGAEDVALEIHKLRAHQQEIRQLEAVARERAASFRAHLNKMLEGSE